MDNYVVYCTKEQTKRAYELGAPIWTKWAESLIIGCSELCFDEVSGSKLNAEIPTVEQMCGWLRENEILATVEIHTSDDWLGYSPVVYWRDEFNEFERMFQNNKGEWKDYEEAIIEAIDVALEHIESLNK